MADDAALSYYQSLVPQSSGLNSAAHHNHNHLSVFQKWRYSDSTLHLWDQDHVGVWLGHVYFYKALWIFRCSSRVENCNLGVNLSTWWLAGGPWWGGTPGWGPEHLVPEQVVRGKGGSTQSNKRWHGKEARWLTYITILTNYLGVLLLPRLDKTLVYEN